MPGLRRPASAVTRSCGTLVMLVRRVTTVRGDLAYRGESYCTNAYCSSVMPAKRGVEIADIRLLYEHIR